MIVLRALYYFYYYKRGKHYEEAYIQYISKQDDETSTKLAEFHTQIKQLFRLAGLSSVTIPYVDTLGLGQIARGHMSPSDNMNNLREDVVSANLRSFERAIGVCKSKAIQSFNPIFWAESFIYLPTNVLSYLGVKKKGSLVKIAQLVWWLFVAFATVVGVLFNAEFVKWVEDLFQ